MRVAGGYGYLSEDKGIALRASSLINTKGVFRQITMNDLFVGRSVDEALRLVQAFQFTVSPRPPDWLSNNTVFSTERQKNRMNMGNYVRRIGRRARKRFVRILRQSWTTLPLLLPPPLMVAYKRTARRMGPSARASTDRCTGTRGDEADVNTTSTTVSD